MQNRESSGRDEAPAPYGLHRPDLAAVRSAVERVFGADGPVVMEQVLARAGLTGSERDAASAARAIQVMAQTPGVLALCARSLQIRTATYDHLAPVAEMVGRAS